MLIGTIVVIPMFSRLAEGPGVVVWVDRVGVTRSGLEVMKAELEVGGKDVVLRALEVVVAVSEDVAWEVVVRRVDEAV